MLGLGWGEIILLGVVTVFLVGPKQLPQVIKTVSKFMAQLKGARDEWTKSIRSDKSLQDLQKSFNEAQDSFSTKKFEEAIHKAAEADDTEKIEDTQVDSTSLDESHDSNENTEVYSRGQDPSGSPKK